MTKSAYSRCSNIDDSKERRECIAIEQKRIKSRRLGKMAKKTEYKKVKHAEKLWDEGEKAKSPITKRAKKAAGHRKMREAGKSSRKRRKQEKIFTKEY